MWSVDKVRSTFIRFFKEHGHQEVASSSVVPSSDPSLLFANAGMNQFKDVLTGHVDPPAPRVCSVQKCIRAGGKHNDLEDVGKDGYHHTFFEMLGSWSFDDYKDEQAIRWAWELLTETYCLSADRLYATYHKSDPATRDVWLSILPANHVLAFGDDDNLWEMGETGPCGKCTEIHYDRVGGRDAASRVNKGDPSVIELWNIVFVRSERLTDGTLRPLTHRHIDTGMGLERLTGVLQNCDNYSTDAFEPIIEATRTLGAKVVYSGQYCSVTDEAYRLVVDHVRAVVIAVADGVMPGKTGREYVVRRIIRRAVRASQEVLGCQEDFMSELCAQVIGNLGRAYPELENQRDHIISTVRQEERAFAICLRKGLKQIDGLIRSGSTTISGPEAFKLWDTHGLPLDLTKTLAANRGLCVDSDGYERCMTEQQTKSRSVLRKPE